MYKKLKNKRLLILGATGMEVEIINAAKEMGIYTIVTDNHLDWHDAPAKEVADEAWDISWSDIDTLKKKCLENNIDGCMAGFSEARIINAEKLSKANKKTFYSNGAYLDIICDKVKFKNACKKAGITIPKEYKYTDKIDYPVIVKPADNGGSRGISICYNDKELELGYQKAKECSTSGNVLIEEYIKANEIMVYFTVHNGQVELSAMCDRIMHLFDKNITQLPIGYYYPSKYLDILIKYNFEKFKKLIKELNINDGLIAFQSFVKGHDVIPFDPTYRLDGTMAYHMIDKENKINVLKMLINKSITGKMGLDKIIQKKENPHFKKVCFELPILLKNGTIKEISGFDEIKRIRDVIFVYQNHFIGDKLEKKADFSQILCRIQLSTKDNETLMKNINRIFKLIKVVDENNNDMIINRDLIEIGDSNEN